MDAVVPLDSRDGVGEKIAALSGQNFYACYQCGRCTAGCPFSFGPQRVIRHLQLGQVEEALELQTPWNCAECLTCALNCPKDLNPARIMRTLRTLRDGVGAASDNGAQEEPAAGWREALEPYYRGHRKSLRSLVFANIDIINRLGSATAPFSNWLMKLPGSRLVNHYLLRVHKSRSLPSFHRPSFPVWFRGHTPSGDGHKGPVLLFHDTYMDYNAPQVGIAATELLEKAGFQVELTDTVCCGRPMISKGFLEQAASRARTNVARLYEHARRGVFIVGCEPSCLLTLREEYFNLVDEPELREQARVVARQSVLIDEFLAMLNSGGELELNFREAVDGGAPVLFHAHCQQKATVGSANGVDMLRLAGYRTDLTRAACCGMAGAFGYEKEHYQASRAAGERALFPAVRARPDAQLVVMGISCRHQIEHFTGRHPRHFAEVLRDAVT